MTETLKYTAAMPTEGLGTSDEVVPLRDLAREWGIDVSTARKFVIKSKITTKKLRDPTRRGQKVLCLTPSNADRARQVRREESMPAKGSG